GAGYTGSPIANAQELELIAFEQNQIEQFARVWFGGPDDAAGFLSLLKARPPIRGLARIPLMLSLLSRMFTAKKAEPFPQHGCEIYEQCLRELLKEWKEKDKKRSVMDINSLLQLLSASGYELFLEEKPQFKESYLWKKIEEWLAEPRNRSLFPQWTPDAMIARLVEDGILIKADDEHDPDYLFFNH